MGYICKRLFWIYLVKYIKLNIILFLMQTLENLNYTCNLHSILSYTVALDILGRDNILAYILKGG